MANYCGHARTNYVAVSDMPGLIEALQPFDILISKKQGEDLFCLLSQSESGGWPSSVFDDDDNEIEFSFEDNVMPFVKENECLVTQEAGSEKLRYLVGEASAFIRKGGVIESVYINIDQIYSLAQEELGAENITQCSY